MSMDRSLCATCAWRKECQKKFKSEGVLNCKDYSRDHSIKIKPAEAAAQAEPKKKKSLWDI